MMYVTLERVRSEVIYRQQPNKYRYMQIGSRIGLALAILAELVLGLYFGLVAAILAALAVPFVGEMLDCVGLFVAIILAVIGFYLGMLGGLIVWSTKK